MKRQTLTWTRLEVRHNSTNTNKKNVRSNGRMGLSTTRCTIWNAARTQHNSLHYPKCCTNSAQLAALSEMLHELSTTRCTIWNAARTQHNSLHYPKCCTNSAQLTALSEMLHELSTTRCTIRNAARTQHNSLHKAVHHYVLHNGLTQKWRTDD
jgi:S-adenosylmethionine/arginine decarboxylase-like enzyme